jgi:hypothetical protein
MKSSQADSHFTAEQNSASATACATTVNKNITEQTRTVDTQYCHNVFSIFFTGKIMKTASVLFLMVKVSDEENHLNPESESYDSVERLVHDTHVSSTDGMKLRSTGFFN